MGATGLMWWIDRWRKSTAYMDLTLEEQGAYRNLLDEAFLRNGALPNDERLLARACGDVTAWKRVRDHVLARFELKNGVLRNETLDDVLQQTNRRIAKQKRYRDRKRNSGNDDGNGGGNASGNAMRNEVGNAAGNATGHNAGNEPGYLDPDPDRELSTNQESSRRGRARVFDGARLKVSEAQHRVVLDEIGSKAAEVLDFTALYRRFDAELCESQELFDTLPWLKRRVADSVRALRASGALLRSGEWQVDWFEECQQLHGGECGGSRLHRNRMVINARKSQLVAESA